jgi:hypothetical protein
MRRAIKSIQIITAAALVLTMFACPAIAGTYVVDACSPSTSSGPWTSTNTFSSSFSVGNLCGGPAGGPTDGGNQGGLYAQDIFNSPASIPDGSRAGWTFSAPAGATISAISYYRHIEAYNDQDLVAGLFAADGTALEQCKIPWPFPPGASNTCSKPNGQAAVTFSGLNASGLFLGVMCHIVRPVLACGSGGTPLHAVRAVMYSARVTLSENSAPTVTNVGGPLWGSGVVAGVMPVTFAAADPIGIQDQAVRSDTGATIVSVPQACDFTQAQPCPQVPSGSLSVDTRRIPDGPHTFSLVVTDAAGNSQVVTSPTVIVDNDGPSAPTAFTATAKGGGSNVIALAWRNPSNPPAPITGAMVQLCEGSCPAATTVNSSGAAQITAPGPGLYSVRLWLLDNQGRGGPHNAALASVRVPSGDATSPGSTKTKTKIAAVLKGSRLRVSGTMARTGRVKVSWRSKLHARTLGSGWRIVTIRKHRISATFTLNSRSRRGTTRIAIRSGRRIVAQAKARRAT